MSQTTERLPLAEARAHAEALVGVLADRCEQIEIAGSIRREKPDIGDIELLCQPIIEPLATDLWGNVTSERVPLYELLEQMRLVGTLAARLDVNGRPAFGARYQRLVYAGVALDLFICRPPAQFGVLYAIRTGPGEFSRALVTQRRFGGLLPNHWRVRDGQLHDGEGQALVTPDEETLFAQIGLDWIAPAERRWPLPMPGGTERES